MKKRLISVALVLSFLCPCLLVPSYAAPALPSGAQGVAANVLTNSGYAAAVSKMLEDAVSMLKPNKETYIRNIFEILVGIVGYGQMPYWKLQKKADFLNALDDDPIAYSKLIYDEGVKRGYWLADETNIEVVDIVSYIVAYMEDVTEWHLTQDTAGNWIIVNSSETYVFADVLGRYPYANDKEDLWITKSEALSGTAVNHVANRGLQSRLNSAPVFEAESAYIGKGAVSNGLEYNFLYKESGGELFVWCDYEGKPYGVPLFDTQAGQDRVYNNDGNTGDQPLASGEAITDIDANFIYQMFPDGSFTWIDNITFDSSYDEGSKTYYIDASTSYDIDNNNYYTYNYHYEYHIDYTSITYIGQTAEYDEVYEYYYQLPDGRSSADLTAEELQALNTQIDVLPYIRSADDTSIRALYHFDGDTRDSSYWSYAGDFKWNSGASLTYMDAGAFDGALYLSELEHDFTITLPANLGTGDFTVQFRYYQSATPAPVSDSTLLIGGFEALGFNGEALTSYSGVTSFAPITPGVWNEICIMRYNGRVYRFLNGVLISSFKNVSVLNNVINFHFGADQQTYKYFDELRVINKAVYPTDGYTPSSVPFDTNLALVLPDSQLPVADEYWNVQSSGHNILADKGLDWWTNYGGSDSVYIDTEVNSRSFAVTVGDGTGYGSFLIATPNSFDTYDKFASYNSSVLQVDCGTGIGSRFIPLSTSIPYGTQAIYSATTTNLRQWYSANPYSFFIPVALYDGNDGNPTKSYFGGFDSGSYTLSMVSADGTIGSFSFTVPSGYDGFRELLGENMITFNGYRIGLTGSKYDSILVSQPSDSTNSGNDKLYLFLSITPVDSDAGEFIYLELVDSASTDLSVELVSSVVAMDKDDLHTPSLAVRTDLEITGYQIGGVRPSLPEKGLVWALVEAGRITSLQIYNGQAWEEVDGRIWTGSRWVPYYAYDVLLLKDMWDIVEADPTLNPIYTETGFWTWLQNAWKDMLSRLDAILAAINNISGVAPLDTCKHMYQSNMPMSPTCTDSSHVVYTCSLCGDTYTETVAATGHDWIVSDIVTDDATDYVFVDDISDCTDTSKKYVLPDGYIYEWHEAPFTLPDGYRQIEYIETTGTQYLNTGFVPNQDTKSVVELKFFSGDGLYGARRSTASQNFALRVISGNWQPGYSGKLLSTGIRADSNFHIFVQDKDSFYIDGVLLHDKWEYSAFTAPNPFAIGGINAQNAFYYGSAQYKYCELYDDGSLVRKLIPCMNLSGDVGMYDVVHGVFYGSSGEDAFIAGAEVEMDISRWVSTGHKYGDVPFSYKVLTCSKCGITTRDYGDGPEVEEEWKLIDLGVIVMDGTWAIVKGIVRVGIGGLSALADGVSAINGFFSVYDPDSSTTIFAVALEEG